MTGDDDACALLILGELILRERLQPRWVFATRRNGSWRSPINTPSRADDRERYRLRIYSNAISATVANCAFSCASNARRFARTTVSSALTSTFSKNASTGACNRAKRASTAA